MALTKEMPGRAPASTPTKVPTSSRKMWNGWNAVVRPAKTGAKCSMKVGGPGLVDAQHPIDGHGHRVEDALAALQRHAGDLHEKSDVEQRAEHGHQHERHE